MHPDTAAGEQENHVMATVNDQWNFLLSRFWNQMIHLVIRFNGHLDEARLGCAVEMAARAEPLVGMRFVEGNPPYFSPREGVGTVFTFIESEYPDETLHEVLTSPLDPATGPMAGVRLIRSDRDLLCISMNHTITDAYGVKAFGSRIARLYRAGGNGYQPLKNEQDRSFNSVFQLVSDEERERACRRFGEQTIDWGIPGLARRRGGGQYRIYTIPPGSFSSLKEEAARLGLTINDVLLSAFIHSLAESFPDACEREAAVLTSQDLRRYLNPDSYPTVANLSVAFEVPFSCSPGTSWGAILGEVRMAMSERKKMHAGIGAAEYLCRQFSSGFPGVKERLQSWEREGLTGTTVMKPFFSNMGIIPEGSLVFGPPVAGSTMLPPLEYPPGFMLAACTARGSLTISTGFCSEALPDEWVSGFLERMGGRISRFTSG
jgi:NRPS condensation-like uncharacterized protein